MRLHKYFSFLGVLLLLSISGFAANPVPIKDLTQAIAENRSKVFEFKLITEAANELGLRVWLFGGTAAGYAHYVKWDMLRKGGDTRFVDSRFDYDFFNIYRSTQDADLVVDGTPEQASKLEDLIRDKLSHLQGSKSEWEVRLLRFDRGMKQSLLNNPDYLNQHTDSNSTGMIELTMAKNESVVRDLREWNNNTDPFFLKDVAESKLHYYFSPLHETTSMYKAHKNPPIFSVIRYLTKAFQYELEMRPEDLEKIQSIIKAFKPEVDPQSWDSWATGWIDERGNGAKLIKHAVNIEYAIDTLDKLGLRKKLIAMSDPKETGSLGWWLNKEPLRTFPVGKTKGRKLKDIAKELKIPEDEFVVSHETSDFLAYESITRDTTGRPNVLISRNNAADEAAVYGDGFYVKVGRSGAAGTGYTIRYTVDMNAVEGSDFLWVSGAEYLVIRNKAMLKTIPESLNIGPVDFFKLLAKGGDIEDEDKGIFEKLKRKIGTKVEFISDEEDKQICELVKNELKKKKTSILFLEEISKLPKPLKYLDLTPAEKVRMIFLTANGDNSYNDVYRKLVGKIVSLKNADKAVEVLAQAITTRLTRKVEHYDFIDDILTLYPQVGEKIPAPVAVKAYLNESIGTHDEEDTAKSLTKYINQKVRELTPEEIKEIRKDYVKHVLSDSSPIRFSQKLAKDHSAGDELLSKIFTADELLKWFEDDLLFSHFFKNYWAESFIKNIFNTVELHGKLKDVIFQKIKNKDDTHNVMIMALRYWMTQPLSDRYYDDFNAILNKTTLARIHKQISSINLPAKSEYSRTFARVLSIMDDDGQIGFVRECENQNTLKELVKTMGNGVPYTSGDFVHNGRLNDPESLEYLSKAALDEIKKKDFSFLGELITAIEHEFYPEYQNIVEKILKSASDTGRVRILNQLLEIVTQISHDSATGIKGDFIQYIFQENIKAKRYAEIIKTIDTGSLFDGSTWKIFHKVFDEIIETGDEKAFDKLIPYVVNSFEYAQDDAASSLVKFFEGLDERTFQKFFAQASNDGTTNLSLPTLEKICNIVIEKADKYKSKAALKWIGNYINEHNRYTGNLEDLKPSEVEKIKLSEVEHKYVNKKTVMNFLKTELKYVDAADSSFFENINNNSNDSEYFAFYREEHRLLVETDLKNRLNRLKSKKPITNTVELTLSRGSNGKYSPAYKKLVDDSRANTIPDIEKALGLDPSVTKTDCSKTLKKKKTGFYMPLKNAPSYAEWRVQ